MDAEQLKAMQAPLKQKYKDDPAAAVVTLRAESRSTDGLSCKVATGKAIVEGGFTPRLAETDRSPAQATCCSKRSSPAPA